MKSYAVTTCIQTPVNMERFHNISLENRLKSGKKKKRYRIKRMMRAITVVCAGKEAVVWHEK